jgi:hypothetical protein
MRGYRLGSVMLATLAGLANAPAWAGDRCGVETHARYGETRAFFQDVWAGCAGKICQISASDIDRMQAVNIAHELRFVLDPGTLTLGMQLTAVTEMANSAGPMKLVYGRETLNLTGLVETRDNVVNVYHLTDAALADSAARAMISRSNVAKWTFSTEAGAEKTAQMPLRGATKALEWVTCMAKGG